MSKIVNVRKDQGSYIYIGRKKGERFHFGNPFTHLYGILGTIKVDSRDEAVEFYELWLRGTDFYNVEPTRREWILTNLHILEGKNLW